MRERRIVHEWNLLERLATENPERVDGLRCGDEHFSLTLREVPAFGSRPGSVETWMSAVRTEHSVRITFPRYYPSMPAEVYVEEGVFHPNAHPDTGFVCIWTRHLARYTVEHTLGQLCRVLTGQLFNADEQHVMQPAALAWYLCPAVRAWLPLSYTPLISPAAEAIDRPLLRRRLS